MTILPYRHPLLTARVAANIDDLSGGRFVLGVGVGWSAQEYAALGVPFERRGAITDEYLSAWVAQVRPGRRAASTQLLQAGTARMEALPGVERWGDYNGIARDPVGGAFVATFNQVAQGAGRVTDVWQQVVHLVTDG